MSWQRWRRDGGDRWPSGRRWTQHGAFACGVFGELWLVRSNGIECIPGAVIEVARRRVVAPASDAGFV